MENSRKTPNCRARGAGGLSLSSKLPKAPFLFGPAREKPAVYGKGWDQKKTPRKNGARSLGGRAGGRAGRGRGALVDLLGACRVAAPPPLAALRLSVRRESVVGLSTSRTTPLP